MLVMGVPEGNTRPAIWLQRGRDIQILARFYGPRHLFVFETFLTDLINTINSIHDDHEKTDDDASGRTGEG